MQAITPVTHAQLLATGQDQPALKLELYDGDYWINICDGFSFLLSDCDATTDWTGTALSIDGADYKEGTGSLKDNVAAPVAATNYYTFYVPLGSWDWSTKKHILFWLISDRPNTAFAYARLYIEDTLSNWRYWNLTFSAGEWTAIKCLLSAGDGESGTPPNLALIDDVRIGFRTADTTAFYKKIDYLRLDNVAAGLEGKNYLETISMSLGGASMTPNPIGGTWNATLSNEDSIFHPQHPTSPYKDYLKTGRKIRASIGATYNDTDYFWQRVIGVMDEPKFSAPDYKVSISGADYMKFLQDTELKSPDNYWGTSATFDSIPSDGKIGSELYAEADAMEIGAGEANNVTNWPVTGACTFASETDAGGGSVYVGKLISTDSDAYTKNSNVGTAEAGKEYRVTFKYKKVTGTGQLRVSIWQDDGSEQQLSFIDGLESTSYQEDGKEITFYFTAIVDGPIIMKVAIWNITTGTHQFRIDQISIWNFIPYWKRYYELPVACKGVYRVILDGADVWQGEKDEGWYYTEDAEPGPDPPAHPARIVWFDDNKTVAAGSSNLVIYYFMVESPENAVARLLFKAGLYASEAAALADMEYTATGITIDKIWFEAGSTCLNAIKKLCERCDYRFFFKWDGTPVFKPKPAYSDSLTDGGLNLWDDATHLTHWSEIVTGTSTINREATEKVEGDYSCRLDVDASNSDVRITQANIPLTPLKRYKLIIWYKNSVAGKTCRFKFFDSATNVFLKPDGTWSVVDTYVALPNSIIWKKYELYFYAHADYSTYVSTLRSLTSASSSIYFDKVSIWREEFTFSDQKHIGRFSNYQCRDEIKNRIVIEGMKQAEPVNKEETIPPELKGEDSDSTSIGLYGERTLTIKNHLFQSQASIDAMCTSLLAEYKDPSWFTDLEIPFNCAPLELGDKISWKIRLSPSLEVTEYGIIRDIKIDNFNTTYRCEII